MFVGYWLSNCVVRLFVASDGVSDSCIGVELDCSALLLAKPALVGICKEGFICQGRSLVAVGCCCKRSRCTRDRRVVKFLLK